MTTTRRRQVWIIALLVLAFLGRSLAVAAMPCQLMSDMPSNPSGMDHSMAGTHHDMGHMSDPKQSPDTPRTHDCCASMDQCSAGGCSLPATGDFFSLGMLDHNDLIADLYPATAPTTRVASLFRPPKFR